MDEQRAALLLGSTERRTATRKIEIRTGSGSTYVARGYASVVEHPYEVYGGPERGGWIETVKRGAFDTTLAANPDVVFLTNHEGLPLARTRSGTLQLRADNTGLESEATVDRRDPDGQALEVKMERGDLDQMSFGFRVTRQSWNEDYTERDITEVNLDNGDVSIVTTPANPATSMSLVSARSAVRVLREMELSELRGELGSVTPDELRQAQERLGELVTQLGQRASVSVSVCTDSDDDAEDYADGGADEGSEGEPDLSALVALAVDLLTQAASGLQKLSATDDGRERADAVVRRFATLLSAADFKPTPVEIPVADEVRVVEAEVVEAEVTPVVEERAVERVPSRSRRSVALLRDLIETE